MIVLVRVLGIIIGMDRVVMVPIVAFAHVVVAGFVVSDVVRSCW